MFALRDHPTQTPLSGLAARHGNTAADRLVRALEASPHVGMFSPPPALQTAINDYVGELRTQGLPPERALINVKRVIFEAGVPGHDEDQKRFLEHVITWCIEAYYRQR
jgi:hypothetical protein